MNNCILVTLVSIGLAYLIMAIAVFTYLFIMDVAIPEAKGYEVPLGKKLKVIATGILWFPHICIAAPNYKEDIRFRKEHPEFYACFKKLGNDLNNTDQ